MSAVHKTFNAVGFLSFLFMIPLGLAALGIAGPAQFMAKNWGFCGSAFFQILVVYFLLFLKLFFGGDQKASPVFFAYIIAFFLFATFAKMDFMVWFASLADKVFFLNNPTLNFFTGLAVLVLGLGLSYAAKLPIWGSLIILLIFTFAVLLLNGFFHLIPNLTAGTGGSL